MMMKERAIMFGAEDRVASISIQAHSYRVIDI